MVILYTFIYIVFAHTRTPQLGKVGSAAESSAQVARQGTDVGALAADDAQVELHGVGVETGNLDAVDVDVLGLEHHVLPLASHGVGALSVYLAGAEGGWGLLDVADKLGQRLANGVFGDVGGGKGLVDLVLHIIARRGGAQLQRGFILLGMGLQRLYLLGTLAGAEYQHAGSQRVEGAGVAYLDSMSEGVGQHVAHVGQRLEAGNAIGLVDGKYLTCLEVHVCGLAE